MKVNSKCDEAKALYSFFLSFSRYYRTQTIFTKSRKIA